MEPKAERIKNWFIKFKDFDGTSYSYKFKGRNGEMLEELLCKTQKYSFAEAVEES